MTNQQNNTSALPALLRTADGVDTLETNSLCCAAAGIIAPSSATTEVLIPHERLREAATPNATLIAQNRPPAQPVEGYKGVDLIGEGLSFSAQIVDCKADVLLTKNKPIDHRQFIVVRKIPIIQHLTSCLGRRNSIHQMIEMNQMTPCRHMGTAYVRQQYIQPFPTSYMAMPRVLTSTLLRFFTHSLAGLRWHCVRRSVTMLPNFRCQFFIRADIPKQGINKQSQLLSDQFGNCFQHGISLRLPINSTFLGVDNRKSRSTYDGQYRANSLNPIRGIFFSPERIQHNKQCPTQCANCQKSPGNPDTGDLHRGRHTKNLHTSWLLAIKKNRACPFPSFPSMKEAT